MVPALNYSDVTRTRDCSLSSERRRCAGFDHEGRSVANPRSTVSLCHIRVAKLRRPVSLVKLATTNFAAERVERYESFHAAAARPARVSRTQELLGLGASVAHVRLY